MTRNNRSGAKEGRLLSCAQTLQICKGQGFCVFPFSRQLSCPASIPRSYAVWDVYESVACHPGHPGQNALLAFATRRPLQLSVTAIYTCSDTQFDPCSATTAPQSLNRPADPQITCQLISAGGPRCSHGAAVRWCCGGCNCWRDQLDSRSSGELNSPGYEGGL